MKIFLFFLFISQSYANTFSMQESGARFNLKITRDSLIYRSEMMNEKLKVNRCNFRLVEKLNSSLLGMIPTTDYKNGLTFSVDGNDFVLNADAPSLKTLMNMDQKIMSFLLNERKICRP